LAKNALHEVAPTPVENDQLKRTTRRRKQLVWERVRVVNRIQRERMGSVLTLQHFLSNNED